MSTSRPFAQILARQLADSALRGGSGIATCSRGNHKRLFCLIDGRLATVVSNVIEEQFIETLVRLGDLDVDGRTTVADAARNARRTVGAYLASHQAVPADRLVAAATEHARVLLASTLDWSDGSLDFAAGRPDLKGEPSTQLEPVAALIDVARAIDDIGILRDRIGPPDCRPVSVERADELLGLLPDDPVIGYLIERCDGTREASALIGASPAEAAETWRVLYALMLVGGVELSRHRSGERAAVDAKVTRNEVMTRLERAESADYYAILEVNTHATPDQVRAAYYFLARRFHPDRFRSGRLSDLLPRIETYFAQVTEASNTLSDPELRKEFDTRRAAGRTDDRSDQDTTYLAKQNYLRAKNLIQRGRFTDAVTALENAIKLDEGEATYHMELGSLLAANPRFRKEAEEHLLRASTLDPALIDVYLALGNLYEKTGRIAESARSFRELLRWEPGHLEAIDRLKAMGQPESIDDEGGRLSGLFKG